MSDDQQILKFYGLDTFQPQQWPVDHRQAEGSPRNRKSLGPETPQLGGDRTSVQTHSAESVHSGSERLHFQIHRMADQIKDWDPLGIKKSVFTSIPHVIEGPDTDPDLLAQEREMKSKLSASNRKFHPRQFLYEVHKETPYPELETGLKNLRYAVNQRSEALKTLVQNNFDRFVAARNKIDVLDNEIRAKDVDSDHTYGTAPLDGTLDSASHYASEVYSPIIHRRARAEKIRNTLTLVERYKFYFNLPSSLGDYIQQEKFEVAVREYKKGKALFRSLIESRQSAARGERSGSEQLREYSLVAAQLNSSPESKSSGNQVFQPEVSPAFKRIIEKVWLEVESTLATLRAALYRHLSQPWRSVESQEKVIGYVLEIDAMGAADPVTYYLQSQLEYTIDQLKSVHVAYIQKLENFELIHQQKTRTSSGKPVDSTGSAMSVAVNALWQKRNQEFLGVLALKETMEYDATFSKDLNYRKWQATVRTIKQLSDILTRSLPDFWKLAKIFMDHRYPATWQGGNPPADQSAQKARCQEMAGQVVQLYILLVSDILRVSDPMYSALPLSETNTDSATSNHLSATTTSPRTSS
ncbi:exocyst complex component Sec5-domain-containing protein, partial [Dimargaris cristalligena]